MDRQTYRQQLAAKLRGARAEAGLTQKEVEAATGITQRSLSRYERAADAIEFEELLQLAALYDVPLERILDEVLAPLGNPPSATRASSNRESQRQVA